MSLALLPSSDIGLSKGMDLYDSTVLRGGGQECGISGLRKGRLPISVEIGVGFHFNKV